MTNLQNLKRITDEDTARTILDMIRGALDPCEVSERADAYRRSCYHAPDTESVILEAADELLGTCGTEGWPIADSNDLAAGVSYCNVGDSYVPTLFYVREPWSCGRFTVSCYATMVERFGGAQ